MTDSFCNPEWHNGEMQPAFYRVDSIKRTNPDDKFAHEQTFSTMHSDMRNNRRFSVCALHIDRAIEIMLEHTPDIRVRKDTW